MRWKRFGETWYSWQVLLKYTPQALEWRCAVSVLLPSIALCQSRCCQLSLHISGFLSPHRSHQTTVLRPGFPFLHLSSGCTAKKCLLLFCHLLYQSHPSGSESSILSFYNHPQQEWLRLKLSQWLKIFLEKNFLYFPQEELIGQELHCEHFEYDIES